MPFFNTLSRERPPAVRSRLWWVAPACLLVVQFALGLLIGFASLQAGRTGQPPPRLLQFGLWALFFANLFLFALGREAKRTCFAALLSIGLVLAAFFAARFAGAV